MGFLEKLAPHHKELKKYYIASFILAVTLLGARFGIIDPDSSIPIIGVKVVPAYFLGSLAAITLCAYIFCLSKIFTAAKVVDKFPIVAVIILTIINGIAIVCFITFYIPLHMIVETILFLVCGFIIGTIVSWTISGFFYIRSSKEMMEKWLPRVPFAIACTWRAAKWLPLFIVAIILFALIYHFCFFPYRHGWLISFSIGLSLALIDIISNLILFGVAIIFSIGRLRKYAIRKIKIFESAMEIHDRDYLLFGHGEKPTLSNQPLIILATRIGSADIVLSLLKAGENPDTQDALGWTALMYAAAEDYIEIVKLMIEYGANVNIENVYGRTALHFASRYGFTEIVKILIAHKAIVNALNDHTGLSPLFIAIENGHVDVVKALLAGGADINLKNRKNQTALEDAETKRMFEIAKLLRVHLRKTEHPKPHTFLDSALDSARK